MQTHNQQWINISTTVGKNIQFNHVNYIQGRRMLIAHRPNIQTRRRHTNGLMSVGKTMKSKSSRVHAMYRTGFQWSPITPDDRWHLGVGILESCNKMIRNTNCRVHVRAHIRNTNCTSHVQAQSANKSYHTNARDYWEIIQHMIAIRESRWGRARGATHPRGSAAGVGTRKQRYHRATTMPPITMVLVRREL